MGDEEGEVLADLEGEEAEEGSDGGGDGEEEGGEREPVELPDDPSLQRLPAHSEPVRGGESAGCARARLSRAAPRRCTRQPPFWAPSAASSPPAAATTGRCCAQPRRGRR